jgi:hypothetical protein
MLHHEGKLAISGKPGTLTFHRIIDHGDRVEDLGEYELIDIHGTNGDYDSDPRGSERDLYPADRSSDHLAISSP